MIANIINNFDFTILKFWHNFAESTGNALKPVIDLISVLGEKGWFFILLSLILIIFKKTRKIGFISLGALCFGVLFTNIILKNVIGRARPFEFDLYYDWWVFAGKTAESGFSFPSGHVTATMASMFAIFLNTNKKYSWSLLLVVILMGISRNYLMVHFPSDVIGAIISGGCAAIISNFIVKNIYTCDKLKEIKFINRIIGD